MKKECDHQLRFAVAGYAKTVRSWYRLWKTVPDNKGRKLKNFSIGFIDESFYPIVKMLAERKPWHDLL